MKDLKKILGILLAAVFVLCLAIVPVFANGDYDGDDADDDDGITTVPPQDDDDAYDEAFENEPRTPGVNPGQAGDPLLTILQEQVAGTWQKAREAGARGAVTRVRIDVLGKRFILTRGTRTWTYEIVQFTGDTAVDMPRFTLSVSGQGRRHQFTILAFSHNTLYLGHSAVPGLQFWGTYQRAVEGR